MKKELNEKSSLIDRRFFLKAASTTVAAVASVSALPALAKDDAAAKSENSETAPVVKNDDNQSAKQWKAGWMAF